MKFREILLGFVNKEREGVDIHALPPVIREVAGIISKVGQIVLPASGGGKEKKPEEPNRRFNF